MPLPFDGTVEGINPLVVENPGLINVSSYTEAWLIVARPDNLESALAQLQRGPEAVAALREWVDRYDIECMRCTE